MDKAMLSVSAARLFGSAGLVISLCVVAVGSSMPGSAQSHATGGDQWTPEYCLRLLARLNDLVHISPAPPPPARGDPPFDRWSADVRSRSNPWQHPAFAAGVVAGWHIPRVRRRTRKMGRPAPARRGRAIPSRGRGRNGKAAVLHEEGRDRDLLSGLSSLSCIGWPWSVPELRVAERF